VTKTSFTLKLVRFDETKKVPLIKEIKNVVEGMNLVQVSCDFWSHVPVWCNPCYDVEQAKKFVESAPQILKSNMPKDEAEKTKAALEALGAVVEMD
jgi:large subunit ribosomal protein L7/L12